MANLPRTYVEGFHDLEAVKAMEYRPLGRTGLLVSKLGIGGATLGGPLFNSFDEDESIQMVRTAIRKGINYIDTAYYYGQGKSEIILGKALKGIPRQAYYIATKVGRYEADYEHMFDFTVEKTRESLKQSLQRLQLDFVDVIQIHDIDMASSLDIIINQTLPELSRHVAEGRAKYIGVTGYTLSVLKECVQKTQVKIDVVLNYARFTLIDDSLVDYIPFFKERNIGIICAAAPCMGLLTSRGPQPWHPANNETKKYCKKASQYCQQNDVELAKLALWHTLQCPDIATFLVGMLNSQELSMNLSVVNKGISDNEMKILNEIKEKYLCKVKAKHFEGAEREILERTLKV